MKFSRHFQRVIAYRAGKRGGVRHCRNTAPGLYTALLAQLNNGTGVGLVEIYDRGAP